MSIASEILRLQAAKADIKSSLRSKGVTVSDNAKLDAYSALVDSISVPSGTINITQNGTVDVTQYASASVNVSGGGSSATVGDAIVGSAII